MAFIWRTKVEVLGPEAGTLRRAWQSQPLWGDEPCRECEYTTACSGQNLHPGLAAKPRGAGRTKATVPFAGKCPASYRALQIEFVHE